MRRVVITYPNGFRRSFPDCSFEYDVKLCVWKVFEGVSDNLIFAVSNNCIRSIGFED